MRYLSRTTLGELTGLNYPPEIRVRARELLRLLEAGKIADVPPAPDDVPLSTQERPSM